MSEQRVRSQAQPRPNDSISAGVRRALLEPRLSAGAVLLSVSCLSLAGEGGNVSASRHSDTPRVFADPFEDSLSNDITYTPVGGARGWNCCTWFYTEQQTGEISETGFSTFWEGTIPPDADALPDVDADGVMDRCDNCPSGFANRDQSTSISIRSVICVTTAST